MNGKELIDTLNRIIDDKEDVTGIKLKKFIKEHPGYAYNYIDIQLMQIEKIQIKIKMVSLTMSHLLSE